MTNQNNVANLTWDRVAARLQAGAAAILPVGAGAKQHGLHLPMSCDLIQADYFARRLAEHIDALIWPAISYGHYPAFTDYAGSVSLSATTFKAVMQEILLGIRQTGAHKILILNTGLSTIRTIDDAIQNLGAESGILHLKIYDGRHFLSAVKAHGLNGIGHADELETSIMLALAPDCVDISRASDTALRRETLRDGPLSPNDTSSPNYAPAGNVGTPSLASADTGQRLVEAIMADLETAARQHLN